MIMNYIQFDYDEFGCIFVRISKDGEVRKITNLDKIFNLIDILEKHGYTINGEMRIVKNARKLIKEYEKANKTKKEPKKRKRKLEIHGDIDEKMVVSRKNKSLGKKIAAITLATALSLTTAAFVSKAAKGDDKSNEVVKGKYVISETYNPNDNPPTTVEETTSPIDDMINEDEEAFHFSYEDRTQSENINNVNQYDDIFQKYAKMYGLDDKLLKAIACQESGGNHYDNLGNNPAEGIMQIEKSAHVGTVVSAYNFETQETDYFEVTEENLQDIEFNIRIAAMDLRNALESFHYNIPQATQAYNFGIGGMNQTLAICCRNIGATQENLEKTPTNSAWLNYREPLNIGDSNYVEHVFSYLPNNTKLKVLDRNNTEHSVVIANDYVKQKIK